VIPNGLGARHAHLIDAAVDLAFVAERLVSAAVSRSILSGAAPAGAAVPDIGVPLAAKASWNPAASLPGSP
jgi:hypothetical protein